MQKVARNFDQAAARWDEDPGRVRLANAVVDAIRNRVTPNPSWEVLDFGCGTGLVGLQLASQVRTLTGADSSAGMLEVLRTKAGCMRRDNVRTQRVDADGAETRLGRFDMIVSSMTLHHVSDVPGLLRRFAAALTDGGWLFIADLDLDGGRFHSDPTGVFHNGFDREYVRHTLAAAGFSEIEDGTAAEMEKTGADGVERTFSVFLMSARKRGA